VSLRIDRSRAGALPAFRVFTQSLRLLVAGFGALALLSGCGTSRGGPIPYTELAPPDAPSNEILVSDDYKVGPLDTLAIKVFQVADLSGEFEVDLTGNISLPLLGNVKVVDLTAEQVDAKLTKMLGEKYLQNPDVAVGLKASSTRVVTIDGAVNTPGSFPALRPITLMQAIALARGTSDTANPRRIAIFRQVQGQRMAAAFDLTSIRRGEAEDPRVYSGDIIVVDGSGVKAAQRQIMNSLPLVSVFTPFVLR
jgi:polysaccharide export outer membrane protein